MNITKCSCLECHNEISAKQLTNHYKSKLCKSGKTFKSNSRFICKHCLVDFIYIEKGKFACHVNWCDKNPNSKIQKERLSEQNKLKHLGVKRSDDTRRKISELHLSGHYKDSYTKSVETRRKNGNLKLTDITKEKLRIAAIKSDHQRISKKPSHIIHALGTSLSWTRLGK